MKSAEFKEKYKVAPGDAYNLYVVGGHWKTMNPARMSEIFRDLVKCYSEREMHLQRERTEEAMSELVNEQICLN